MLHSFIHSLLHLFIHSLCVLEILATKKKAYADLARHINNIKVDIDNSKMKLDQLKAEREGSGKKTWYFKTTWIMFYLLFLILFKKIKKKKIKLTI